ncbi:uracil-DNA glycosylase [Pseudoleptotrichia goodfellowii]|uniref:Uracil-DNA glycosylase family protein n=1 Tax=Pseudoleptotrichia goodfellowii TaxID=157692 RepID=A0A510JBL3_9FUSO|nr:uracil-DNA glycosylase [Pseudoleptotrichia goodfellowii]BBM36486.1 uracil-DNA glycosylase family protein [Pseudoleptotrichia goodfellowii]
MNIILEDSIYHRSGIKDFGVDPVNERIIMTGEKLVFFKNGKIEKEISGKVKNCEIIKYIKEKNQLFVSSTFFVSTGTGKVYKCDSSKKKIVEPVFDSEKLIEFINFTTGGKIIYIENDILYSYDSNSLELNQAEISEKESRQRGNYKLFTSGENVILKYRELHSQTNIINIFDSKLEKIFEIKTENNHIYAKISDLEYIAGTATGEIEIWNILEKELYNSIKIADSRITYIEKNNGNYFIGTGNGDLIITDWEFKILKTQSVFKNEIIKICYIEDQIFILSADNKIVTLKIIDEENDSKNTPLREKFLEEYNIHSDYYDFFTLDRVIKIDNFIKEMDIKKINYTPSRENIFKVFSDSISSRKVCLIGKDPYFQEGVATGLSFEVNKSSWDDPEINTSLKNIVKLIYKTYTGKSEDISKIREEIENKKFLILPPNKLIKSWKEQGVLLVSAALTTIVGKAGEHHKFWDPFTRDLLEYISAKNPNIVYFLWGKDAEIFEKNILSGEIIKHNHPAISGNLSNEKDFMNGKSFEKTKNIINWTGFEIKPEKVVEDTENTGRLF